MSPSAPKAPHFTPRISAMLDLRNTEVRAPADGTVTNLRLAQGQDAVGGLAGARPAGVRPGPPGTASAMTEGTRNPGAQWPSQRHLPRPNR